MCRNDKYGRMYQKSTTNLEQQDQEKPPPTTTTVMSSGSDLTQGFKGRRAAVDNVLGEIKKKNM